MIRAVLVLLTLTACTISPPLNDCNKYGDGGATCQRERALNEMLLRPRE